MLLKIKILLFVAFVITMMVMYSEAGCGYECNCGCGSKPKPKPVCGTQGEFCGRGVNSKDCCENYICNVAADDTAAFCDLINPGPIPS